jgi:flavin-binding protein dodecin
MGSHSVAKVVEIVGSSDKGWAEAADTAVKTASKSIKHITGVSVESMTAQVKEGRIATYKTTVKVAFGVDD